MVVFAEDSCGMGILLVVFFPFFIFFENGLF